VDRDQLEAVIWELVPVLAGQLLARRSLAMDTILAAADAYGLDKYGITAERRSALAASGGAPVHLAVPCKQGPGHKCKTAPRACNSVCYLALVVQPVTTDDPAKVTCGRCRRSGHYRQAVAA
jgi:hypothetical protein